MPELHNTTQQHWLLQAAYFELVWFCNRNWGSSVSMVAKLQTGHLGFSSWQGLWWDILSLPLHSDGFWSPPCLLPKVFWGALTLGVKQLWH